MTVQYMIQRQEPDGRWIDYVGYEAEGELAAYKEFTRLGGCLPITEPYRLIQVLGMFGVYA